MIIKNGSRIQDIIQPIIAGIADFIMDISYDFCIDISTDPRIHIVAINRTYLPTSSGIVANTISIPGLYAIPVVRIACLNSESFP